MINMNQQYVALGDQSRTEDDFQARFPNFREPKSTLSVRQRADKILADQGALRAVIEASYDDPNFVAGETPVSARPTTMRHSRLAVEVDSDPGTYMLYDLIDAHYNHDRNPLRSEPRSVSRFLSGMLVSMRLSGKNLVLGSRRDAKIRAALLPQSEEGVRELEGFDGWMMPVSQKSRMPLAALAAREGTLAKAIEMASAKDPAGVPTWPWAIPFRANQDAGRGLTFTVFEAIDHGHGFSLPDEVRSWSLTDGCNRTVAYALTEKGMSPSTWKEDTAFPWLMGNQGASFPVDHDFHYLDTPAHLAAREGRLPDDFIAMVSETMPEAWEMRGVSGETLAESLAIGAPELADRVLDKKARSLIASAFYCADPGKDACSDVPAAMQTVGFVLERLLEIRAHQDEGLIDRYDAISTAKEGNHAPL